MSNYNNGVQLSGFRVIRGDAVEAVDPGVPVIVVYRVGRTTLIVLVYAKSM